MYEYREGNKSCQDKDSFTCMLLLVDMTCEGFLATALHPNYTHWGIEAVTNRCGERILAVLCGTAKIEVLLDENRNTFGLVMYPNIFYTLQIASLGIISK